MIQTQLMNESGKKILLKDIHNVQTKSNVTNTDMTILQQTVNALSEMNGAYVKLITHDSNELRGIFFQDKRMRETFARFPEFLCIDATYKLNDLRMPCYILLVENGNGQSEIVGMWLVADETEELISEVVSLFKEQNPKWEDVKMVMSDKDFVERDVFRRYFPEAKFKICLFHVLRTFRREVTMEKMNISADQRLQILDILQKLSYARNETEYSQHHETLKNTGCEAVNTYFENSWHPIRDERVTGLSSAYCLGNQTNNRLESLNQKLKQVISKHVKLNQFATEFVSFLGSHRTELDGKMSKTAVKVPCISATNPDNAQYRQLLTHYAYGLVEKQLDKSEKESVEAYGEDTYRYQVSVNRCTCPFYTQYILPCCHMFALRQHENQPIYDRELVHERWTRSYYLQGLNCTVEPTEVLTTSLSQSAKPKSQQQKFRAASHVCQQIASCVAESSGHEYTVKLDQLKALLESWKRGDDVTLDIMPKEDGTEDDQSTVTMVNTDNEDETEINPTVNIQHPIIESHSNDIQTQQSSNLNTEEINTETLNLQNSTDAPQGNIQAHSPSNSETEEIINDQPITNQIQDPQVVAQAGGTEDAERPTETGECTTSEVSVTGNIASISLPATIRKRGRPKGSEQTVIGLPKKRLKLKKNKGPQAFDNLPDSEKAKVILSWFVDIKVIEESIKNNRKITEDSIECDPEKIFMAAAEVPSDLIKPYLEDDAWTQIQATLSQLQKSSRQWTCKVCNSELETRCVGCDSCLNWFHYHCAGISNSPKVQNWFCDNCKNGQLFYVKNQQ